MFIEALILALEGVSYPPPSDYDAERAVAYRFALDTLGGDVDAYGGVMPAQVTLERCHPVEERPVRDEHGLWHVYSGHSCIMRVFRMDRPEYQVSGFFHYDGGEWRYYGPVREALIVEPTTYEVMLGYGPLTPKDGAITYNGRRSINDKTSIYRDIIGDYELPHKPAPQPPHDDIYSLDPR
ncbi:MAG: hypothetical protein R3C51_01870 [Parvularculaceae bacterium]